MSKLNGDVLYYIFQDLHYLITANPNNERKFKKSLHSCLFVNKYWCNIMIQILWSYPYKYVYKKNSLLNIIISHLSDNSIKILKDKNAIEANFQKQKLSFNYVRFCKYLDNIHRVIPDKWLLKEEIYKLFISECSSIKCLSSDMISDYSIYKYPGSNISLSNLYELDIRVRYQCTSYHELAQICRSIEKIHISIHDEESSGMAELIEMQKQIKYILIDKYCECKKVNQALEKHVNSIVHLDLVINNSFQLDFFLPKLINLQYLRIHDTNKLLRKHEIYLNYYNLQILDLLRISLDMAIDIIQNTNGSLWKIKIRLASCDRAKEYNQSIYKYCPNIKYVTVFLNREGTLKELKNIFIKCQHLVAIDIDEKIRDEYYDKFLDLLVELAPFTLYKIHIDDIHLFNEEFLKLFFTNWSNRCKKTLHLYDRYNSWHKFIEICEVKDAIELNYHEDDFWNHEIKWSNDYY